MRELFRGQHYPPLDQLSMQHICSLHQSRVKEPLNLKRYGLPPVSEFLTDDARAAACARK